MFYCSVHLGMGKTRLLSSNQWDVLRREVAAILKKKPAAKWGALRDDDGFYVGRFRRDIRTYPKARPDKYLPEDDMLKQLMK